MGDARPLRADAERNRRRIVDAAVEVIGRRGLDAAVDEIARAAGVGRGTLYRRFATKEELVRSIVVDRTEKALTAMERAAASEHPWEALTGTLHALASHLAHDRGLFDTLTRGGRGVDVVPQRPDWFRAALEPPLARAQRAGAARADVSARDLIALAAAVSQIVPGDPGHGDDLWERYLAVALDGVRAVAAGGELPHAAPEKPPSIR
jgi:AcrR family transcriptional regulator